MEIKKLWSHKFVRVLMYFVVVAIVWETVVRLEVFPAIMFPSVIDILNNLFSEIISGELLQKISYTLMLILIAMLISVIGAIVLVFFSSVSPTVKDIVKTLISIMDPLPGVAILPLAILWVGIGEMAIIFIMIHSVLWPMVLYALNGFSSVPQIYDDVGQSIGASKFNMIKDIYLLSAMPSIITGFKTGWARAWRALISAEMIFGVTGVAGGLGWDIYIKRSYFDIAGMFSTLIVIMIIGIVVEELIFARIEKNTVIKWGMVR